MGWLGEILRRPPQPRRPDAAAIARMERELAQDVEIAAWPHGRMILAGGYLDHFVIYHMHAGPPCPPTCPGYKPAETGEDEAWTS